MAVSDTSSQMGIQVRLLLLNAPVKRTVGRGEVLNFTHTRLLREAGVL